MKQMLTFITPIFLLAQTGLEIAQMVDQKPVPKDLINSEKLGEPYIRTLNNANSSKQGLGLGTFIGKTLLEKNFAIVKFQNSEVTGGAEVIIKWKNKDLKQI